MSNKENTIKMHQFLLTIWKKMPNSKKCRSCGQKIYGEFLTVYFDHLLPKKKYPEFEFEEKNIYFCCGLCHNKKENGFPNEDHSNAILKAKTMLLNKKEE